MKKAWVIDVNMGYGHQRTAYPLRNLAFQGKIINANFYQGIPEADRKIWEGSRKFYESISRAKRIPLIGNIIFEIYDKFQKILSYYPKRDLSKPDFVLKKTYSLIKKGWGKDLIFQLKKNPLPLITTFYIPAFMAEVFNFQKDIFCIVCDADIARTWVSLNPKESKIKYFAPCNWVRDRLKLYGVKEKNIFLTGYPLPKELIGTKKMEILKEDVAFRLLNLDPKREFYSKYGALIREYIGPLPKKSNHPLTIMFSVGGAGAQKEIAIKVLKSLAKKIKENEVKIILSVGIRESVKNYFEENIKKLGLESYLSKNIDPAPFLYSMPSASKSLKAVQERCGVEIVFSKTIEEYFDKFNQKLKTIDILWTKPSELSFYSGLGIPIIISPSMGSHEDFNKRWLLRTRAGVLQENPKYTDEWLFDLLKGGRLAEAALKGFIEVEKMGTFNIEKIICSN